MAKFSCTARSFSSKLAVEERLALPLNEATLLLERIITHVDGFTRHQQKLERLTHCHYVTGIIDTEKRRCAPDAVLRRCRKRDAFGRCVERHTGVPVYIQHDISARTMAEALLICLTRRARRYPW